jgi:hypothetical protein
MNSFVVEPVYILSKMMSSGDNFHYLVVFREKEWPFPKHMIPKNQSFDEPEEGLIGIYGLGSKHKEYAFDPSTTLSKTVLIKANGVAIFSETKHGTKTVEINVKNMERDGDRVDICLVPGTHKEIMKYFQVKFVKGDAIISIFYEEGMSMETGPRTLYIQTK